jgi:CDGSH-type Zn-finger protein
MTEITITPLDDGPILVRGPIRLVDAKGNPFETNGRSVALCRCGASAQKPFCDGTHVKIGFRSVARAVTHAARPVEQRAS